MRAAISTEYIESDPPIYRSYYPAEDGPAPRRSPTSFARLRLEPAVRRPRAATSTSCCARCSSTSAATWPRARAELPAAGARLGLLPQQGGLRDREDRERQRRDAVRRPRAPRRRRAGSRSTRSCSTPRASRVLFSLSRAYFMVDMDVPSGYVAVPADADADEAALGAVHGGRAREAGEDALLPRPAAPPAPLARTSSSRRPGTRGLVMHVFNLPSYPYVLKVIKDEFGPLEADRPRDREAEVPAWSRRSTASGGWRTRSSSRTSPCRATASRRSCSTQLLRARAVDGRDRRRRP